MTYITYHVKQWEIGNLYGITKESTSNKHNSKAQSCVKKLSKPDFLPTYLVRVSDMRIVRGSEMNEGYCALSYSWNQTGHILPDEHTGHFMRVDQGQHKIVSPGRMVRKKPRGRRRVASQTKLVKFEGLIQQICQDFGINYIWYDQMCIDQSDVTEIRREIRQMHKIYANATFVVALVPEFQYDANRNNTKVKMADINAISSSQWSKRLWTFEEAFVSREIVFVGRNAHMWSNVISQYTAVGTREIPFLQPLGDKSIKWTASTILFHAHIRLATKKHDYIFALATMLPDIIHKLNIDYKQDVEAVMTQFYGLLVTSDFSVLCFGAHLYYHHDVNGIDISKEYKTPIQGFDLPSWVGASGEHIPATYLKIPYKNFKIDGRYMTVTSPSIPISIKKGSGLFESNLDEFTDVFTPIWMMDKRRLLLINISSSEKLVPFFSARKGKRIAVRHESFGEYDIKVTHILPVQEITEKDKICISASSPQESSSRIGGYLSLTQKDCTSCEVLSEIQFEISPHSGFVVMPVVTKTTDSEYYKAIGICIMAHRFKLSEPSIEKKEKTIYQMTITEPIVYETSQWEAVYADGELDNPSDMNYSQRIPLPNSQRVTNLKKYRPTWLMRVDNWEKIKGSQVPYDKSYHALSYTWEQAGDISEINKKENGKETKKVTHQWIGKDSSSTQRTSDDILFEVFVQRICKQFGVEYIWFDQLCIDQGQSAAKQHELQQLHSIYKHAEYTLVLIPELEYDQEKEGDVPVKVVDLGIIANSKWSKRVWTLEEAYMSQKMLFIGRNVHLWSDTTSSPSAAYTMAGPFLYSVSDKSIKWATSTTLYYARTRQSTRAIDRYRALANMFPELFSLDKEDEKVDLFKDDQVGTSTAKIAVQFYGILARNDLTILKFGSPLEKKDGTKITEKYEEKILNLPSWTGVNGFHVPQSFDKKNKNGPVIVNPHITVDVTDRLLTITNCNSIQVSIKDASHIRGVSKNGACIPQTRAYELPHQPVWTVHPRDLLYIEITENTFITTTTITTTKYGIKPTHILPVKKENKLWTNTLSSPTHVGAYLSLTEDRCAECTILSGIRYEMGPDPGIIGMPVVCGDENGLYKAIGLCIMDHSIFTYPDSLKRIETRKQFLIE
ncbi:hypothetical protein INT45_009064 [Circinella minor]|uniref:Heterokaryon incompatibility domain-containing protein n=1 Tax=Circinella minor TaxID=1195481 RepID=A0A8H7S8K6_9FUNG|nr:hypothetical protein INT45_009064 [Circinella minor]